MKSSSFKLSVGLVGFLQHKTPANCEPTRALVGFPEDPQKPDHKPDQNPATKTELLRAPQPADAYVSARAIARYCEATGQDLGDYLRAHHPGLDSPNPRPFTAAHRAIIPAEVRSKIEAIEVDARAKGWPAELLWNARFWDCPRGLAAVLDHDDEIVEVRPDYIAILKTRRDLLRFRRVNA
jgi:hypothetical protein